MTYESMEPSLFYDPPYERPLEDEFAWYLVKYLAPISALHYQTKILLATGERAWVDFVVEREGRLVGFEIGELDDADDYVMDPATRQRDALVMATGTLDVLYRLRAHDACYHIHDALHIISRIDGALFSPRGRRNLEVLATPLAMDVQEDMLYADDIMIRRLRKDTPAWWMRDYDEALEVAA